MSEGIEGVALCKLRTFFRNIGNRGIHSYFLGVGVTSIIQSSNATVVLGMNLTDKKLLSVKQATYISLGARVGTTITGILVALSTFNISSILMSLTLAGIILMMFCKDKRARDFGKLIGGLGVLFVGIYLMSFSINDNPDIANFLNRLFLKIDFPPLLFLIGVLFTALIQSSSAMSGILIVMIEGGSLSFSTAIFIIIGATVGTTIVPLFTSFSMKTDAKKVAINFTFSALLGALVVGTVVWLCQDIICSLFDRIRVGAWRIAFFNVVYSLIASIVVFPFVPYVVTLGESFLNLFAKDEKRRVKG